jgi:putative ABC transport system ATP-binding protein
MPNETTALRGLSLRVPPGQFVTLIGGNGAGKSTLVTLIAGAVSPVSGSVSIRGVDISHEPEHERARRIARVFQDPLAGTCPAFSIDENLALAARRGEKRGLTIAVTRQKREAFARYLGEFGLGLEDRLGERVGRLSGGQRQALSILMALMRTPDVLLLDEHTAALDPRNQQMLLDMTDMLVRETGCTTLMVTHNMDQALKYGTRMIMMHRGQVLLDLDGQRKRDLTVPKLVQLFHRADDAVLTDEMLLA